MTLNNDSLLIDAAMRGDLSKVRELLDKGANILAKDNNGKTPLDVAIEYGESQVASFLREKQNERPVQRKRRHHHGDHDRHHLSYKPLAIDLSNQPEIAASSGARPSSWINVAAHAVVDIVMGVSQFISSPFKPAIDMEHSQPYGVDVVKPITGKGHTVTAVPEINATLVNNTIILGILAAGQFNKTQCRQPIHENLLSPREQSMRLNNIDEDMIMGAIQQTGNPNTDMDEVKISGNKTGMWKGSN